jgi:hypothetical protein
MYKLYRVGDRTEPCGTPTCMYNSYLTGNTLRHCYRVMLLKETVAVHSENHTEHTDTCGQNTKLKQAEVVVHIVTTGFWRVTLNYMFT